MSEGVRARSKIVFCEIEFEEAEIAKIGRHQMFEYGVAKALAEKSFISHEHVGGA